MSSPASSRDCAAPAESRARGGAGGRGTGGGGPGSERGVRPRAQVAGGGPGARGAGGRGRGGAEGGRERAREGGKGRGRRRGGAGAGPPLCGRPAGPGPARSPRELRPRAGGPCAVRAGAARPLSWRRAPGARCGPARLSSARSFYCPRGRWSPALRRLFPGLGSAALNLAPLAARGPAAAAASGHTSPQRTAGELPARVCPDRCDS